MEKINLPDPIKIAFAHALKNGFRNLQETKETYDLNTSNGAGLYRSNFVNAAIEENLSHICQIEYPKRKNWEVGLIYYPETKVSITILSEQRFKELEKKQNKETHYLEALNSINDGNITLEKQINFNFFDRNPSELQDINNRMYTNIVGEIDTHIIIIYKAKSLFKIEKLNAVIVTSKFDMIYEENWDQFLEQEYIQPEILENKEEKANVSVVTLKNTSRSDTLVALKKQNKINNND